MSVLFERRLVLRQGLFDGCHSRLLVSGRIWCLRRDEHARQHGSTRSTKAWKVEAFGRRSMYFSFAGCPITALIVVAVPPQRHAAFWTIGAVLGIGARAWRRPRGMVTRRSREIVTERVRAISVPWLQGLR